MLEQNYFQRLETALIAKRRSKGDLAAHLGVALSTVSRWRVAMPKAETVMETAAFLGVDAKWLMTGKSGGAELENADCSGKVKEGEAGDGEKMPTLADAMGLMADAMRMLELILRKGEIKYPPQQTPKK